jgi:hypothetical protein
MAADLTTFVTLDHLGHFPGYGRFPDGHPDPGQIRAKLGRLSDPDPDPQSSTAS